ncbi:hypothetical protein Tco_0004503 [Tanacetum coccineum]
MMLYEALEKSMARDNNDQLLSDLAEARKMKNRVRNSLKKPHGSPPLPQPLLYTSQIKPSVSSIPEELHMDDDMITDEQAYSSGAEDIRDDHIPIVNLRQSWWKPLTEDRPATPEPAWTIPSSDLTIPTNNWASALKSTYTTSLENSLLLRT